MAAAWLAARLPAAERAARARALLAFHDRVRWLEDEDRISWRETCPLLAADGRCSIHPVRPLSCRSLSSLDAADCRRALRERMERDGGGEVQMNVLQHALYTGRGRGPPGGARGQGARRPLPRRLGDGGDLPRGARARRIASSAGERLPIE